MDIPTSIVAQVVDPNKPESWVFQYIFSVWTEADPPASPDARKALLKSYLAQYCEPYRSAGLWLGDDIPVFGEKVGSSVFTL